MSGPTPDTPIAVPDLSLSGHARYLPGAKAALLFLALFTALNVGLVVAVFAKRLDISELLLHLCGVAQPAVGLVALILSVMARRFWLAALAVLLGACFSYLEFMGLLADALAQP